MGISVLALGKKGRLYVRFVLAAALIIALVSAYVAFAASPSATPTLVSGRNFKANSTFKWDKRTLYQPQNRSLVDFWKLNGNTMGDAL